FFTNGLGLVPTNLIADASLTAPANDWLLMDLFTTAPNENASKGQLSINQSGVAAWAAALDGVVALQNTGNTPTNVSPAIVDPTNTVNGTNIVEYLVNCINATRAAPPYNGTFTSLGQILSVPQLSVSSPFLNTNSQTAGSLSDDVVERIPQQIMSLLRLGTPRYVIFAYGQSLKPAPHSIVTSGPFFGMCTNYQITGEVATRTVVRFDNFPIPGHPANPKAVVESFNVLSPTQ
ncbi:MAG TPA: hypothetical protein VFB72_21165, partial [Verrucomicrobiae bacterium]|nr:hypothetical protein [Verrucomicrobiae bacterium]